MQNNLHRRFIDVQSNKLKKIHNVPLSTVYETGGDVPLQKNDSIQSPDTRNRDKSIGPRRIRTVSIKKNLEKSPSTSVLIMRTSSLSPARVSRIEESASKKKMKMPVSGTQAGLLYAENLTNYEYKEINKYQEVYFLGDRKCKFHTVSPDSEGRYRANIGDHLAYRYEILEILGKGTFGNVYRCFDHKRNTEVAVKIMRNVHIIKETAEFEIENLEKIGDNDQDDSNCIVKMRQYFDFRGHICISFELLSISLYQFLRKNQFRGISGCLIKRIAVQILIGLRYLHKLGFIHCDLKPENILLKSENKSSIKIIDFGSACYKCTAYNTYIQSRYYRAPEITMGCGFNEKIDIWSFGCILYELHTGQPLFSGESERDQLNKILHVIGLPPKEVLLKARRKNDFFNESSPLSIPNSRGLIFEPGALSLNQLIRDSEFCDFLEKCLEWNPEKRFSAEEALKHPWVVNSRRKASSRRGYQLKDFY